MSSCIQHLHHIASHVRRNVYTMVSPGDYTNIQTSHVQEDQTVFLALDVRGQYRIGSHRCTNQCLAVMPVPC